MLIDILRGHNDTVSVKVRVELMVLANLLLVGGYAIATCQLIDLPGSVFMWGGAVPRAWDVAALGVALNALVALLLWTPGHWYHIERRTYFDLAVRVGLLLAAIMLILTVLAVVAVPIRAGLGHATHFFDMMGWLAVVIIMLWWAFISFSGFMEGFSFGLYSTGVTTLAVVIPLGMLVGNVLVVLSGGCVAGLLMVGVGAFLHLRPK